MPPGTVKSHAFSRRFSTAWWISWRSTKTGGNSEGRSTRSSTPALAIEGRAASSTSSSKIAQIGFFQLDFHGPREIQESFHGAVQAVDFAVEHFHGLLRLGLDRHIGFQHFQPEAHGIQRVFHFVRDAGGNAAERREPFGNLQLVADAFERLHVAQGDERAHARAMLANHLHAHADAPRAVPPSSIDFRAFRRGSIFVAFDAQDFAQRMAAAEKSRRRASRAIRPTAGPEIFPPRGSPARRGPAR